MATELSTRSCALWSSAKWLAFMQKQIKLNALPVTGNNVQADDVNTVLRTHLRWGCSTVRLPSAREAKMNALGSLDYHMDANTWWLAESISPLNAAMLLSGHNPNTAQVDEVESTTNLEMGPQDFRRLKNGFEGASSVGRTLKDWTAYARERELKIHSWIAKWEAWFLEVDASQLPRPRMTEVVAETPARKRKHYLHDFFMVEQSKCSGSSDLWPRLVALARSGTSQLIGATEKGIQYLDAKDEQKELSKKQLDAYMKGTNLTRHARLKVRASQPKSA